MNFSIADKLQNVRERIQKATIASGRSETEVQLLAVSKKKPAESLVEAFREGQRHFGENYLNEALDKQLALKSLLAEENDPSENALIWHFIGPIQSNKTRAIAELFAWVHSVDRLKIAKRLNEQRPESLPALNICIQVNIDEEESKSGMLLEELPTMIEGLKLLPRLSLRGLMCIPRADQGEESLRKAFLRMKAAFVEAKQTSLDLDTLSMGMSGDVEIAIDCGSTMVRVGTALFGER